MESQNSQLNACDRQGEGEKRKRKKSRSKGGLGGVPACLQGHVGLAVPEERPPVPRGELALGAAERLARDGHGP